jgi:hypothetical protein
MNVVHHAICDCARQTTCVRYAFLVWEFQHQEIKISFPSRCTLYIITHNSHAQCHECGAGMWLCAANLQITCYQNMLLNSLTLFGSEKFGVQPPFMLYTLHYHSQTPRSISWILLSHSMRLDCARQTCNKYASLNALTKTYCQCARTSPAVNRRQGGGWSYNCVKGLSQFQAREFSPHSKDLKLQENPVLAVQCVHSWYAV